MKNDELKAKIVADIECQKINKEFEKSPKMQGHPKMQGQIWEDCPNCGRDPVYLPLMICERCWPKG